MKKIYALLLAVILVASQTGAAFACGAGGHADGSKDSGADSEE